MKYSHFKEFMYDDDKCDQLFKQYVDEDDNIWIEYRFKDSKDHRICMAWRPVDTTTWRITRYTTSSAFAMWSVEWIEDEQEE